MTEVCRVTKEGKDIPVEYGQWSPYVKMFMNQHQWLIWKSLASRTKMANLKVHCSVTSGVIETSGVGWQKKERGPEFFEGGAHKVKFWKNLGAPCTERGGRAPPWRYATDRNTLLLLLQLLLSNLADLHHSPSTTYAYTTPGTSFRGGQGGHFSPLILKNRNDVSAQHILLWRSFAGPSYALHFGSSFFCIFCSNHLQSLRFTPSLSIFQTELQSINQSVSNVLFSMLARVGRFDPQQLLHLSLSNGSTLCIPYFLISHFTP